MQVKEVINYILIKLFKCPLDSFTCPIMHLKYQPVKMVNINRLPLKGVFGKRIERRCNLKVHDCRLTI